MSTLVEAQIPNTNTTTPVTANELALIRVDDDIVDWIVMFIVSLKRAGSSIPNFDSLVF